MTVTCLGCKFRQRIKIRGQWCEICRQTGRCIPMRACMSFVARFK